MNIGDIIIWESMNLLLLIPVVLGLVMLVRLLKRHPVFTERDWLFLFGHPREKALSLRLWLRFAALLLVVVIIGLAISFYVLPFSLGWSVSAVLLTIAGILLFVPRWL